MTDRSRNALRVTVERGQSNDSTMWGHVIALRRGSKSNANETFIPIELGVLALVVASADVLLLVISGGFPPVIRYAIRVAGGLLAAWIVVWLGSLVFAVAMVGVITSFVDDASGGREQGRGVVPGVAVGAVGVAAGIGDGALVALYGPISFVSMGVAAVLAAYLGLPRSYQQRRRSAASMGSIFLGSYAIAGAVVAAYVLQHA